LPRMLDDPDVRLVRHVDVHLVDRPAAFVENGGCRRDEYPGRELEDLAPVHIHEVEPLGNRLCGGGGTRATAGKIELRAARAVRAELEAQEAAFDHALHD